MKIVRNRKKPVAVTASKKSQDLKHEHDLEIPQDNKGIIEKSKHEAAAEQGLGNKIKSIAREIDRNVGGEYERRQDQTPEE